MSGRARQVLSRFPAHLDAGRPGKQLGAVVGALVEDLDRLAADLAAVRRAHRLAHADTLVDLLRLAGLHGLSRSDFDTFFAAATAKRTLLAALGTALDGGVAADRDAAAEALLALWGIGGPGPHLALFTPVTNPPIAPALAPAAAAHALQAGVAADLGYRSTVEAVRGRLTRICQLHAAGNGTVRTLLGAALNALDLEADAAQNAAARADLLAQGQGTAFAFGIGDDADLGGGDSLFHSSDLFWHATFVRDRNPLPATAGMPPALEAVGIEENPRRRAHFPVRTTPDPPYPYEPGNDGTLFPVVRRGFGRELLQAEVVGVENRTLGPVLVNRDEGHGLGFAGPVPSGASLVFREDGRVLLNDSDVTSFGFSFVGACFAASPGPHGGPSDPHDFVLDGPGVEPARRAVFAVATPAGALDRDFTFPHAGQSIEVPGIGIGVTRFAFFVQVAHLGSREGTPATVHSVAPRPRIAFADGSVFAADPDAPAGSPGAERKAADLHLSWLEHEAFAVRVVLPPRFGLYDAATAGTSATPATPTLTDRVAAALVRFKPAGVAVTVELADDRWRLGESELTPVVPGATVDPISLLKRGMLLSPSPVP